MMQQNTCQKIDLAISKLQRPVTVQDLRHETGLGICILQPVLDDMIRIGWLRMEGGCIVRIGAKAEGF